MRSLFLCLVALFAFHCAAAQTSPDPTVPAPDAPKAPPIPAGEIDRIQRVIASQVQAFREGDLETAYGFAAPGIQQLFPSPEIFGAMVERGYGQIFSAYRYEFLDMRGTAQTPVQLVQFIGTDLAIALAFYLMETQPDGQWRIAGVHIQNLPQQGV